MADAARQRDDTVVREDVTVERIEHRIVDVRREDAFLEIVEDDDLHRAAEPAKRLRGGGLEPGETRGNIKEFQRPNRQEPPSTPTNCVRRTHFRSDDWRGCRSCFGSEKLW